jgi:amidohydrolase
MDLLDDARALAADLVGDLADLRHRLHRHPEIGLDLPHTQQAVLEALSGLPLEVRTGTSCSSVTAVLRGRGGSADGAAADGSTRPVVLLRGDMDALPVTEEVDVPFRSRLDGVMHACGHDLHTSMLVGAARLLSAEVYRLPGDVVFMFQPGEEGFDGAGHMLAEGVLDAAGRRPDAAFALHVMSNLTARGTVASRPGPLMAASDGLRVVVRGRGGHGSSPHLSRDPVPAACEMVLALQTAMTRSVDAFAPAVLTVGVVRAGTKRNIIPDEAMFEATVRTFDPAVRAVIAETVQRTCRGIAEAHGLTAQVDYTAEYPVTINDAAETRFALGVAADLFGAASTLTMPNPITGSEDFSRVISQVPGAMLFLGALTEGDDPLAAPSNHSPRAAFDDRVLPDGAALYAALAARRLSGAAPAA